MIRGKIRELIKRLKEIPGRRLFAALFVFCIAAAAVSAAVLINTHNGYKEARDEYAGLRGETPQISSEDPAVTAGEQAIATDDTVPDAMALLAINPDYIGWIRIDGTGIDYPVVQGKNNSYYMYRTFSGEHNGSGSIFMDWKCEGGISGPFAVVYGHNMRDGSMFMPLHSFSDKAFLEEHPFITIFTPEGEELSYRIFSVRVTDVSDRVFSLFGKGQEDIERYFSGYSAPEGAGSFLVLSTCTASEDDDERLLVFAAMG